MLIRQLPYFVAAAEEESLVKAAERLNLSQPALSRRIQDLERSLGVELFVRSHGGVRLTQSGKDFYKEARRLVSAFDEAVERQRNRARKQSETLAVSLNEHALRNTMIVRTLRQFRSQHATCELKLSLKSSAAQLQDLKDGKTALALLYLPEHVDAAIESRPILESDPYVLALPADHPLARRDDLRVADLHGEDLIWASRERVPALYEQLVEIWRGAGVEPHVTTEIDSAEAALNAVSAGMGLAVVHASNAGREPADVVLRKVSDLLIARGLHAAWRRDDLGRNRIAFVGLLQKMGVTA